MTADDLVALTADPVAASAWTSWLASGDPSHLPEPLQGLELTFVNVTGEDVTVDAPRVVSHRRFEHPDGTVWTHIVADARDGLVYVQRLLRPTSRHGTIAVIRNNHADVWVDGPGAGEPPDGFEALYALMDAR